MNRRTFMTVLAGLPMMSCAALVQGQAAHPLGSGVAHGKRVLLTGLDPAVVEYRSLPGLPDLNPEKLQAILDAQQQELNRLGYAAQWCLIDPAGSAERKVVDLLRRARFGAVLIGAGVRLPPDNLMLFERLVNAVHQYAPGTRIVFNATANDTSASVQRWL